MNSPRIGWVMLLTDINSSLIIAALYCGCVCINIEPIVISKYIRGNTYLHWYAELYKYFKFGWSRNEF